MVRVLFTRRWLTALAAAALFAVASYYLGVWQWGRHETKVERNALLDAHFRAAPVPIDEVLGGTDPLRPEQDWTRVTITGSYADRPPVLVRNRQRGSATGFEVLAPFQLSTGRLLVVDRGWIASSDQGAATVPSVPPAPAGSVTLVGWLRPGEAYDGRRMPAGQLSTLNLAGAAAQWQATVAGAYLNLETERPADGTAAVPRPLTLDPPDRDLGPNQAYAYQWWLFMVAGFGLVFLGVRREWRETDPTYVPGPKKVRIWDEEDE
ncbi:MAG: SURF1 family protein [Nostocoides sp.]